MPMRVIKPPGSWRLALDAAWLWGIPTFGFWLGAQLLAAKEIGSLPLWAAGMSLSVCIAMYIVVGIGAGWLKMWQFNPSVTPTVCGVVPQVGFMYAGVILGVVAFAVRYVAGVGELADPLSAQFEASELLQSPAMMATLAGTTVAIAGCIYDLPLLEVDLLRVYTREYFQGSLSVGVLLSYGPGFFGLVGALSGVSAWIFLAKVRHATLAQALGRMQERQGLQDELLLQFGEALLYSVATVVLPFLLVFSGPIAWKLGLAKPPKGASLGMQGLAKGKDDGEEDSSSESGQDERPGDIGGARGRQRRNSRARTTATAAAESSSPSS